MYKAHEKDCYPNIEKINDIVQFFLDHRKEILDWTKTFYSFVEQYKNYIEGIQDLCTKENLHFASYNLQINKKTITEVFKKKWKNLSDIERENNSVVYLEIIKTIIKELFYCAVYELIMEKKEW